MTITSETTGISEKLINTVFKEDKGYYFSLHVKERNLWENNSFILTPWPTGRFILRGQIFHTLRPW